MARLVDLGFILAEKGTSDDYDYILLLNPYMIIKQRYEAGEIQKHKYIALFHRAQEIGAIDLN